MNLLNYISKQIAIMNNKLNVGIIGGFQNGKSTFVNCLLDDMVARTGGEGVSTTSINTKYIYGETQSVSYFSNGNIVGTATVKEFVHTETFSEDIDEILVTLWKPLLKKINLIDTPGFDANDHDSKMAENYLEHIDVAIVIMNNKGLSETEWKILQLLKELNIPFFIIMNCTNKLSGSTWLPQSSFNKNLVKEVISTLNNRNMKPELIDNKIIYDVNLLWFWYACEHYQDMPANKIKNISSIINFFFSKELEIKNVSNTKILDFSHFLPLRNHFDSDINWGFPLNSIKWRASFNKAFYHWENKLKEIVNQS